jgi:polyadenylate-binding protein
VKNFPKPDFCSADLRQLFEPYGAISSCTVMGEDTGALKNFGFVCFEDPKAAVKAATTLHCDEEVVVTTESNTPETTEKE